MDGGYPDTRKRTAARRMTFTELTLKRLRLPKKGQVAYWDSGTKGQLGLSILVSAGGTKTYRSTCVLHGYAMTRKLGRVGEMDLVEARRLTLEDRREAAKGIHPVRKRRDVPTVYGDVVELFIEQYAKPRHRTWEQTQRAVKINCSAWWRRPIASITKADAYELLDGLIASGKGPTAGVTLKWMKKLWRWSWERDIVSSPIMDPIRIEYERGIRDRTFTDDEIRAVWRAAETLGPVIGTYVRLMILTAPRKTALARMAWDQLDDPARPTLWTTPFENTKAKKTAQRKRIYLTPLVPLAQSLLGGLPRCHPTLVFPGRGINVSISPTGPMVRKLKKAGAPADFSFHTIRHTVATWLENRGHSEWERGLVLNHSGVSVTSGYSHGYPLDLKRSLLDAWAGHVALVVG